MQQMHHDRVTLSQHGSEIPVFEEMRPMSGGDHTAQIQSCIDRVRAGDRSALDELLLHAAERLFRLLRKMLRDFQGVHR